MATKKKAVSAPGAPAGLTYIVGKQDKSELYELYMVAVGQQMMGEALVGAVNAVVGRSRELYGKKLAEVKETLGVPAEKGLIVNFLTGAAVVQEPASTASATESGE